MSETKEPSAIQKVVNGVQKVGIYIAIGMAAMEAFMIFTEKLAQMEAKKANNES